MKKRIYLSIALSAVLAAVSCQKEFNGTPELEGGGIMLNFVCSKQDTKTTMPGDNNYNENTLTTVDYFLYKEGETSGNAYIHGRVDLDGRVSYNVLVNTSQLQALFAGAAPGSQCDVFVIANYPGEITGSTNITRLRNLALNNNFSTTEAPDNFVMCGLSKAEVINKNQTKAAEGTVYLDRAASKITFECSVVSSVDITNQIISNGEVTGTQTITWVPILSNMKAYLVNGFSEGVVGGEAQTVTDPYLYRYSERSLTDPDGDSWYTCAPFYSYPQSWNDGDENEPFIKLVVPWAYLNTQGVQAGQKQFYYKVPCPGLKMESNTWYHIKLNVAILGGDDFEAMLEVTSQYYVVPWNTQTIVEADAEIKEARYISAPQLEYDMYNVNTLSFPITSSNEATLNLKSVTYYDFKNKRNIDYTSTALSQNWIRYSDDYRMLYINHVLDNEVTSSGFDSSPYVFTFEIVHADDAAYTTGDIVITQYPAMYIEELQSNGYVFVNGTGNQAANEVTAYDDSNTSLSTLTKRNEINDSGDNTNSHMYRIHVTTVSGLNYTIGDPRLWATTNNVTTLNNLGSNYMEAAEINEDMIAPEFMVASSYGKTKPLDYKYAATRCAAYQESGYPAGRWRVPTKAEIMFLIQLSEKNKIPTLFTPDSDINNGAYWCSSGVVYPLTNGTVEYHNFTEVANINNNNWVRCIYDSWYWGDDPVNAYLTTWSGYPDSN